MSQVGTPFLPSPCEGPSTPSEQRHALQGTQVYRCRLPSSSQSNAKVERLNNLDINVFGYSQQAGIHPLYLTNDLDHEPINLLLLTEVKDGKVFSHYCWIKDFDKLCHDQTKDEHRLHYCLRCIPPPPHCSERTLQDHLVYCRGVDAHLVMLSSPRSTKNLCIFPKQSSDILRRIEQFSLR